MICLENRSTFLSSWLAISPLPGRNFGNVMVGTQTSRKLSKRFGIGLIAVVDDGTVRLTRLGIHYLVNPNDLTGAQILAEVERSRGDKRPEICVEGLLEAIVAHLDTISSERYQVPRPQLREQAMELRELVTAAPNCFALAMLVAAIDRCSKLQERRREVQERRKYFDDDDWFEWPSTEAPEGNGELAQADFRPTGMLSYMGYRVGIRKGVAARTRRQILAHIFHEDLPRAFDDEYMSKWGSKGTSHRLRTLAYTMAVLTKNLKRRLDDPGVAISEYEEDLQFLHDKYYVGRFSFAWPSTK